MNMGGELFPSSTRSGRKKERAMTGRCAGPGSKVCFCSHHVAWRRRETESRIAWLLRERSVEPACLDRHV